MDIFKISLPTNTFQDFGKLPGKPSELIRVAINDLQASEKAGFKVDMSSWLLAKVTGKRKVKTCSVCFAGAVMAQTLGKTKASKSIIKHKGQKLTAKERIDESILEDIEASNEAELAEVHPGSFVQEKMALQALNSFRCGRISEAFSELNLAFPESLFVENVEITQYHEDKKIFKSQMLELADSLEKVGY